MIRPPRRSVTRFFIPLIDVLILLFCIFLLMPIVEESSAGPGGKVKLTPGETQVMRQRLDYLQRRVAELEQTHESPRMKQLLKENARLKEEATRSVAEKTLLRHFEIDPNSGALIYYNPDRKEARFPQDAAVLTRLIDSDLRNARRRGEELIWVFLYPRGTNFYHPTLHEREDLDAWLSQREKDGLRFRWETWGGLIGGRKKP